MTGTAAIIMWTMMGLMIAGMATGMLTWAKRRMRKQTTSQPPPLGDRAQLPDGPQDD